MVVVLMATLPLQPQTVLLAARRGRAFRPGRLIRVGPWGLVGLLASVLWSGALVDAQAGPAVPGSASGQGKSEGEPFLDARWDTPVGTVRFAYADTIATVEEAVQRAFPSPADRPRHARVAIVRPTLGGLPLGPGESQRLSFHFEDSDPVGALIDLGNGEYAQAFREFDGAVEGMLTITVAGLATDPICVRSSPIGPPIPDAVWLIVGGLVVAQGAWLLWGRRIAANRAAGTEPATEHQT